MLRQEPYYAYNLRMGIRGRGNHLYGLTSEGHALQQILQIDRVSA